MGLKIDQHKVYSIFEENCQKDQIIANVKVKRDDSNTPHLSYSKYDSTEEVYNYISVNEVNGNVYLTLDGVNAINEDHSNPSDDLNELKFKVTCKDTKIGDSINIDVDVKIVRVNDEPPKILENITYDIYKDDIKEGKIVLDVRTLYPSNFYVVNDTNHPDFNNYFNFLIQDFGRLTITNDGVTYLNNLDFSTTKSINIKLLMKDKLNQKATYKDFNILLKEGSSIKTVPKKAILEQIAQYLAQDLSLKIEKLNGEVDSLINDKNELNDIVFDTDNLLKTFDGSGILEYSIGSNITDSVLSNNNLINYLFYNKNIENKKILNQLLTASKDLINYNQTEFLDSDNLVSNSNTRLGDVYVDGISPRNEFSDFFKAIEIHMNLRIKKVLNDIIKPTITDIRSEYWAEFERIEKSFLKFKLYESKSIFQQIMRRIFTIHDDKTTTSWSDLKSETSDHGDSNGIIGKIWDNEIRIQANEDILYKKATSFESNKNIVFEKGQNDHTRGLIGIVYDIEKRDLEDWSKNRKATNGWQFVIDDSGTSRLLRGDSTVISVSGGLTEIKASSAINLNVNGSLTRYDGTTLSVKNGDGIVKAKTFTGTANKAKYADLAEYYEPDNYYEPGTLLMIGGDKEVTKFKFNEGPYIGPVSSKPGFILNSDKEEKNWVLLALRGRVNIKIEEGLSIKKGQSLFASEKEDGVAGIKPNNYFVGYSLQDFDSSEYTESNNSILAII